MASRPTRPWFRLHTVMRPAGPGPTPTPAPTRTHVPAPPPSVGPISRPLAPPPPAEPSPPPQPARAPTPPPAPAPTPTPPPPAAVAPAPLAVTSSNASVPSSPARGVYTAPSAASPPATSVAITSSTSSTVPPPQASPPKPTATANLASPQTYSPPKPSSTTISSAISARETSPRTIKSANNTPPQSPHRPKPTARPPSPLNLPPSQLRSSTADQNDQRIPLEAEQKTVLVQDIIDHEYNRESQKPSTHGHHAKHEEKIIRKKLSSESEVAPGVRVITLAGENKGAYMELTRSPNELHEQGGEHSHFLHNKGNNGKSAPTVGSHRSDKSSTSSSSSDEGKPRIKDKSHRRGIKGGNSSQMPLNSFTNSNVQGINNSIVYNSSCTHHNPGVHLALTRKPNVDGFTVKSHVNGQHS